MQKMRETPESNQCNCNSLLAKSKHFQNLVVEPTDKKKQSDQAASWERMMQSIQASKNRTISSNFVESQKEFAPVTYA